MSKVKVGQVYESMNSGPYSITSVEGSLNISIRFINTGTTITGMCSSEVLMGKVKDFMLPTVYGVGYVGKRRKVGNCDKKSYNLWINMISRCYSNRPQYSMYAGVTVHKDWHNYAVFAEEIKTLNGYYEWESGENYHLDKDLIKPSEKLYSVKTCSFIPAEQNIRMGRWKK